MNTRSVHNKAQFVKEYIDDHGIDIVTLTKTWLSDGEVVDDLTNGGYSLVHGNVLDLVITHRCSNIITSPVIPTTLLTDHHAVECELRYGKPARQTHQLQYRKYSSIDQKAFNEDVRSMFATNLEKPVDCFAAYDDAVTDAVDKHAPTMTRVVTVRPKMPWHTQQLSDAKRDL